MTASSPGIPDQPSKNFLTHNRGREKEKSPAQDPIILEAGSVHKLSAHPAALSGKMAKISSLRESSSPEIKNNLTQGKATSSLPGAMARVHRKHQEEEIRDRLQGKSSQRTESRRKENVSTSLQMEDPDPGTGKSALLFWCFFGRFAKSVLLAQPLQVTLLFFLLTGLGSIEWSMAFLSPLPGPGPVYDPAFASTVVAGGMLLGMGFYFLLSLVLNMSLHHFHGGIGKMFGLKVMVNAFFPLAIGQLCFIGWGSLWMGESYWRGMMHPEFAALRNVVLPILWIWGAYRVAQAVTGLFEMSFPLRLWTKAGVLALAAVPWLISHDGFIQPGETALNRDWDLLQEDVMTSGAALPIDRYDAMEKRLTFHDTRRKRDLYLYRMQALYRLDTLDRARADALRLDRMAFAGSADDDLAKGLNYLFQNRIDLALPKFNAALASDPDCNPAHQWSALALAAFDLDAAEQHARILMQRDPNVFHLQLLVRILFAREKYQEIWDSTLMVDAPPEAWDPMTLYQGGKAAEALGYKRRAEYLLSLARSKGQDSDRD